MQRFHRMFICMLMVSGLLAVKVIESACIRTFVPAERCGDGILFNPHCSDKTICVDRDSFVKDIIGLPLQEIFTRIYETNYLLSSYSRSGLWSNLLAAIAMRNRLYPLCVDLGITTFLDLGCGDHYWMQTIDFGDIEYIGVDIVPQIIAINRQYFEAHKWTFLHLDATKDPLPKVDLILCRDVLTELCYEDARAVLRSCKASGSKYLLVTMHPEVKQNKDHPSGLHGQYNLMRAPFNLPEPLTYINEASHAPHSWFEIKDLCLWNLDEIEL